MATYTAKLSGYQAAAAAVTWTSGGLASLATNTYSGLSDEIDNSTTKYTHADLYLELGSAAFTGAGSGIEIYHSGQTIKCQMNSWNSLPHGARLRKRTVKTKIE